MSSGDASKTFSAISESSTAAGCSTLRWARIPKNVVRRYVLSIRPRYDAVIAAGESHVRFLTNLIQVN